MRIFPPHTRRSAMTEMRRTRRGCRGGSIRITGFEFLLRLDVELLHPTAPRASLSLSNPLLTLKAPRSARLLPSPRKICRPTVHPHCHHLSSLLHSHISSPFRSRGPSTLRAGHYLRLRVFGSQPLHLRPTLSLHQAPS